MIQICKHFLSWSWLQLVSPTKHVQVVKSVEKMSIVCEKVCAWESARRERELSTNLCPYIWRHINKIEIEICLNNTGCHIWNFMHLVSTEKEFLILIDNVNLTFKCNRQNHCKFLWSDSNTRTIAFTYSKIRRKIDNCLQYIEFL